MTKQLVLTAALAISSLIGCARIESYQEDAPPAAPVFEKPTDPVLNTQQEAAVLQKYNHVDPKHLVPTDLLQKAVIYFDQNKKTFPNQTYITIVDFAEKSNAKRFFVVNLVDGTVATYAVAHGEGSDKDNDGFATVFSNVENSHASSIGYYRTDAIYYGKHGLSLRVDGLSKTNSNVRKRDIVVHGSWYSEAAFIKENGRAGRSDGCFALADSLKNNVITKIKNGSLIYADLSKE